MKRARTIWYRVPPGFVRAVLAGHSSLGLAFAALIYVVCLSGTFAVLANELHRWEQPTAPVLDTASPDAVQRVLTESMTRAQKIEHVFITLPTADLPRLLSYIDTEGEGDGIQFAANADGRIVEEADAEWTAFLVDLHVNLLLPRPWGIFIVGLTGVALLSSLISGLFAHPRVFRDAFHLRWSGSKRLQEADLHNRIGIWGLPFHIIISLTGALLGLTTIIVGVLALALFQGDMDKAYDLFLPPHPVDDPRPAPLPDLAAIMANVKTQAPDKTVSMIILEHPGEKGQGVLVIAGNPKALSRGDNFIFDGNGNPIESKNDRTLGAAIIQAISTLHFGWFGGWAIKLAYVALGLGLTVVTASGVAIYLARRREKGNPAPIWERAWIATVWSQPLALAVSALTTILTLGPPLLIWSVTTLVVFGLAFISPLAAISSRLRQVTSATLLLIAVTHFAMHGTAMTDAIGIAIDVVLLLIAGTLAGTTLLTPSHMRSTQHDTIAAE